MARPTDGWSHVDRLSAPARARRRLRVVLEVLSGARSVASACRALSISEARFHTLRQQALMGAAEGLCPRPPGRPVKETSLDATELESLRRDNQELRTQLKASQIQVELALTMPHVLKRGKKPGKKKR